MFCGIAILVGYASFTELIILVANQKIKEFGNTKDQNIWKYIDSYLIVVKISRVW